MSVSRHGMITTTKVTKRTKATLVALSTIMSSMTQPLHLDLVEIVVSSGFSALHDLSNLCMSLLVILSPSLVIEEGWCALMELNSYGGHAVSHKAAQDIFKGSSAFGGFVSSYFSGSLMDTYGVGFVQYSKKKIIFFVLLLLLLLLLLFLSLCLRLRTLDSDSYSDSTPQRTTEILPTGRFLIFRIGIRFRIRFSWFNLLVNLPSDVVFVRDFIRFVIVFQIVGVAPQRTQHDVPDVVLQRFPHLLPLGPSGFDNDDNCHRHRSQGCGDHYVDGVCEGLRWWEIAFSLKRKKKQATLQFDFAMFYFTTNCLGFTLMVLGRVKLVTSIASLLCVGHYNGFMKNCSSLLVLSTFLLVHLHRMCGLSVGTHHDFFSLQDSLILISSFTLTTIDDFFPTNIYFDEDFSLIDVDWW
ncbi:Folate-biopterin transporter 1, chloroplastic, partial [Mucuna pruriens]